MRVTGRSSYFDSIGFIIIGVTAIFNVVRFWFEIAYIYLVISTEHAQNQELIYFRCRN